MTPEDEIFLQVLRHNRLLDEEQIAEATGKLAALSTDEDAPPPPTLGQFLVDHGFIREKAKAAIERALLEAAPEPSAAPATDEPELLDDDEDDDVLAPVQDAADAFFDDPDDDLPDLPMERPEPSLSDIDPIPIEDGTLDLTVQPDPDEMPPHEFGATDPGPATPPPQRTESRAARQIRSKRQWKPRSKRMVEIVRQSGRRPGIAEEELGPGAHRDFIERIVPSRPHQRFLEHCVDGGVEVFREEDLTEAIGIQAKRSAEVCALWVEHGVVTDGGDGTYTFVSEGDVRDQIDAFMNAWRDPEMKPELRRMIRAIELG